MATPTHLTSGVDSSDFYTFDTASITPGTNCIIVLMIAGLTSQDIDWTFGATVTGGGLTWHRLSFRETETSFVMAGTIWYAEVGGSSPGTFAITYEVTDHAEQINQAMWTVIRVTGYDTAVPFGGVLITGANTAVNGAFSMDLPVPPNTDDVTIAMTFCDADGVAGCTFDSGTGTWTETIDAQAPLDFGAGNAGYRTGSTNATVGWNDINPSSGNYTACQLAVVVRDAASFSIVSDDNSIQPLGGDSSLDTLSQAVGDLLLITANQADGGVPSTPAGCTSLGTSTSLGGTSDVFGRDAYRVATGSESFPLTVVHSGSSYSTAKMLRIVGVNTTDPIQNWGSNVSATAGLTVTLPTVTATRPCLAVAFIEAGKSQTSAPSGWTLYDTWDTTQTVYYKRISAAGSVGGETCSLSSFDQWAASITLINIPYVKDHFNLADSTLTTPWAAYTGLGLPTIQFEEVGIDATPVLQGGCYDTGTFSNDQFATVRIEGMGLDSSIAVIVRSASGTTDGYLGEVYRDSIGALTVNIWKLSAWIASGSLLAAASTTFTDDDELYRLTLTVDGTTLQVYLNDTLQLSTTDGTHASGRPGIARYNGASSGGVYFDDFYAGDFVPPVVQPSPIDDLWVADHGSTQNLSSEASTAVDLAAGASIERGRVLIARVAADNAGGSGAAVTLTISDPRGNVWRLLGPANVDPGAANAGATCWIAWTAVDQLYTDGDDITFNWSTNVAAKAIVIEEWQGLNGADPVVSSATATATASNAFSVTANPSAVGQVIYGAAAVEGPTGDSFTPDDGFALTRLSTGSGTAAANQTINGVVKYASTDATESWAATGANTRDAAIVVGVFRLAAEQSPSSAGIWASNARRI